MLAFAVLLVMFINLRLGTNYVIRVMRIKDKGDSYEDTLRRSRVIVDSFSEF
jgi:hypothetical protein